MSRQQNRPNIHKTGKYSPKYGGRKHSDPINANDKKEIKLMEEHWNERMTDDEWLELCNANAKHMAYKK